MVRVMSIACQIALPKNRPSETRLILIILTLTASSASTRRLDASQRRYERRRCQNRVRYVLDDMSGVACRRTAVHHQVVAPHLDTTSFSDRFTNDAGTRYGPIAASLPSASVNDRQVEMKLRASGGSREFQVAALAASTHHTRSAQCGPEFSNSRWPACGAAR